MRIAFLCSFLLVFSAAACGDQGASVGPDLCENNPCVPEAACASDDQDVSCTCPEGFEGDGRIDGAGCSRIDACNTGHGGCVPEAACASSDQDVSCTCPAGFEGDGRIDGAGCSDIDACAANPCGSNEACTDLSAPAAGDASGRTCACLPMHVGPDCLPVAVVDGLAAPGGDGLTWETAFASIEEAMASGRDTLWIKEGEFVASASGAMLTLRAGMTVVGGFAAGLTGTDGTPEERDPAARTVLSGAHLAGPVLVAASHATVDGMRITQGVSSSAGAGVAIQTVEGFVMRDVDVDENHVDNAMGGGIACVTSNVVFERVSIVNNDALGTGDPRANVKGAGLAAFGCTMRMTDSLIEANTLVVEDPNGYATEAIDALGGGLYIDGGVVELERCQVTNNEARTTSGNEGNQRDIYATYRNRTGAARGGGIYAAASRLTIGDVSFVGNRAIGGDAVATLVEDTEVILAYAEAGAAYGGAMFLARSDISEPVAGPELWGLTFHDNVARGGSAAAQSNYVCAPPPVFSCGWIGVTMVAGEAAGGGLYVVGNAPSAPSYIVAASGNAPTTLAPCASGSSEDLCE